MNGSIRRLAERSPRLRRTRRRLEHAALDGVVRVAQWSAKRLSLEQTLGLGDRVGAFLYRVLGASRRRALQHLASAFGDELTPAGRERLARAAFINLARCFGELLKIDEIRARRATYFEVDGAEHLQRALAHGAGALLVTGRSGNWELVAAYFAWQALPVAAIARRLRSGRVNRLLTGFRSRQGMETVVRESPSFSRRIVQARRSNTLLAMVIDPDGGAVSNAAPLFGRVARPPAAAASLAMRYEIPVVVAVIQRRPQGGHRISLCSPIYPEAGVELTEIKRSLTRRVGDLLEGQLRGNPAEWTWWRRRERRAAAGHLDLGGHFQYTNQDAVLRRRG